MERSAIRAAAWMFTRPVPHFAPLHAGYACCAALLTMRDRGRAGSSPAVTRGRFCLRSPDGAQRNPGRGVDVHSACPAFRSAPCGLRLLVPHFAPLHADYACFHPPPVSRGRMGLVTSVHFLILRSPRSGRLEGWPGRMKAWFETRGCAALLTMRDRGRAGSSPAVTRGGFVFVARMERSAIRGGAWMFTRPVPHSASLHAGYACCAALLTMRDRGGAGSSPAVTIEKCGCRSPFGAQWSSGQNALLRHCRAAAKRRDPAIHAGLPHLQRWRSACNSSPWTAGSSPAVTRGRFCLRSPDGAQRNPGSGVDVHSSCPAFRSAPCGLRLLPLPKWS